MFSVKAGAIGYLVISNLLFLFVTIYFAIRYVKSRHNIQSLLKLIEKTNIGYYRYRTTDGVIRGLNRRFIEILELDLTRREIVGRSISELIIYIEGEKSIREELKRNGTLHNFEYRFRTLKGNIKCVRHNSSLVSDPTTREEVVEALIEDITEEKAAYEKTKEARERYEKLFRSSGDIVIICGIEDMRVEEANPTTEIITGFTQQELVRKKFQELLHPLERGKLDDSWKELFIKRTARVETVIVTKTGVYKEVLMTLDIVDMKPLEVVMAIIKDISVLAVEREKQKEQQKSLEEFREVSITREERIKELRNEIGRTAQQLKMVREKYGIRKDDE